MTDSIRENLRLILDKMIKIKPGQSLLIVAEPLARAKSMAYTFTEMASSMGVDTVIALMEPRTHTGHEPPPSIAAAMKAADITINITETASIGHTTARKEAREAGKKFFIFGIEESELYFKDPVSFKELEVVKERTEKLAEMMAKASVARATTPYGTDVTMSLEGRDALPLSPLSGGAGIPLYGEAAISPVEGTTEGVIVADASVRGWGYVLRKPIRFEVKKGKIQVETVQSDIAEQADRLKKIVLMDKKACNCAAELGIGTCHIGSKLLRGTRYSDYALTGTFHIACGRNNDIGGATLSTVHQDVLMTDGTVKLDDTVVLENGELKI
ncbi:aminopeptidase [Chloroflexota bacterium]